MLWPLFRKGLAGDSMKVHGVDLSVTGVVKDEVSVFLQRLFHQHALDPLLGRGGNECESLHDHYP